MKILVVGATGGTGREIVAEAKAKGHDVVALVRSKAKAGALTGATLIEGDARDERALSRALEGCGAAISALGTALSPFRKVTLLSAATRALVGAMRSRSVDRLVCITGIGAGDSRGHGGLIYNRLILPLLLRNVYADKDRQERIIKDSGLDWIIVRPMTLTNAAKTAKVEATTDLSGINGGSIARADVAAFVVSQLTDDRWLGKTPLIRS